MARGLLKNPADLRAVAFVTATAALHSAICFYRPPLPLWPIWFMGATALSFVGCVINHNHVHAPLFRARWANGVFGCLLAVARGHTSLTVLVPHNLNHHFHVGGEQDWTRPDLGGKGWGLRRLARYLWQASRTMSRERRHAGAPKLSAALSRQLRLEKICVFAFLAFGLIKAPLVFGALVIGPCVVAMASMLSINFMQHDGCDPNSEWHHSRDFVGTSLNWWLFNNGYHTAHHAHPAMHWTQLRGWHEAHVRPVKGDDLDERSLARFILKNYFFGRDLPSMSRVAPQQAAQDPKITRERSDEAHGQQDT